MRAKVAKRLGRKAAAIAKRTRGEVLWYDGSIHNREGSARYEKRTLKKLYMK